MMRIRVLAALLLIVSAAFLSARDHVRIDASSDRAANATFEKMVLRESSRERQKALVAAIVQLNLSGVHSVYEVVNDPDKQQFDAAHVKDQVAGMDADEIIALAASTRKPDDPKVEAK
jgi:hypothetical protein